MASNQKTKQKQSQQQVQADSYEGVPTGRLILAWGVVGIPFIYGVSQVFIKALALFQ